MLSNKKTIWTNILFPTSDMLEIINDVYGKEGDQLLKINKNFSNKDWGFTVRIMLFPTKQRRIRYQERKSDRKQRFGDTSAGFLGSFCSENSDQEVSEIFETKDHFSLFIGEIYLTADSLSVGNVIHEINHACTTAFRLLNGKTVQLEGNEWLKDEFRSHFMELIWNGIYKKTKRHKIEWKESKGVLRIVGTTE